MTVDISQATLDVIEAIRNKKIVQFKYGSHDEFRTVEPESFFGDFHGFQGADVSAAGGFKRFNFDRITEWVGIPIKYKVFVELEVVGYPTDDDVRDYLEPIADGVDPLVYSIKPKTEV